MYGTYIITPEYLSLDRPIRFFGVDAESKGYQPAATINPVREDETGVHGTNACAE